MLSMRTSGPPSWIRQTSILRPACSCSVMDRPTEWLPSPMHQFLKTSIQMPTNPVEQLDHQDHNGAPQHSSKLVHQAHLRGHLRPVIGATTDWLTLIRHPSRQGNLTSVTLIAGHSSRHRASPAQGKSNRCALTLSLLATTVRHIAAPLLHVIIMLCPVHTLRKHKDCRRHLNRYNYKLRALPTVPSV